MEMIAEHVAKKSGQTFYSTLDMTYAYDQVELRKDTARHCNYLIVGGETTWLYKFITGFYGLTTMPME